MSYARSIPLVLCVAILGCSEVSEPVSDDDYLHDPELLGTWEDSTGDVWEEWEDELYPPFPDDLGGPPDYATEREAPDDLDEDAQSACIDDAQDNDNAKDPSASVPAWCEASEDPVCAPSPTS